MVNHKAVKFNAENYSCHLGMIGLYLFMTILPLSARYWQFCEISTRFFFFLNLGEILTILVRSLCFSKSARSHQSWRGVENLAANSARFEKPTNIDGKISTTLDCQPLFGKEPALLPRIHFSGRADQTRQKSRLSQQSRRDSETHKRHGEISARSRQPWRDLGNLGEISGISRDKGYLAAMPPRFRNWKTLWRNLG